jgi:hypothetical protein
LPHAARTFAQAKHPRHKLSPESRPQWRSTFMVGPPAIGYNVRMSFEEDESPEISERQPREAEDQFEDDLMRDLSRQQSSPSQ